MATADALTDTDKIITAAEKFGDKLAQLATQYGPDVADVALVAARVDAAQGIVWGLALAGIGGGLGLAFRALWTRRVNAKAAAQSAWDAWMSPEGGNKEHKIWDRADDALIFFTIAAGISGPLALIFAALAIGNLTNLWRWVGIFEPKAWLAGKLLGWM